MSVSKATVVPIGKNKNQAAISWNVNVVAADDGASQAFSIPFLQQGTPGLAYQFNGWKFVLNPLAVQGAFTFDNLKALRLALIQPIPWVSADDAKYYIPGRVLIHLPSSGEVIAFSAKVPTIVMAAATAFSFVNLLWDSTNFLTKTHAKNPSTIEVYFEQDASSAGGGPVAPNFSSLALTAYNFDATNADQQTAATDTKTK